MCVRACVRAGVRACVRACVCVISCTNVCLGKMIYNIKFRFCVCRRGGKYCLRPKMEIHPLFPVVDILYCNPLLLYTVPIIVDIIY